MVKTINKIPLILFLFVVATYLIAMWLQQQWLLLIFKPLIVGSLLFYFLSATTNKNTKQKSLMIFALVFCLMGDVLLMFSQDDNYFFVLGLSAFLVGHFFYIITFRSIAKSNHIPFHFPKTLLVVLYAAGLLYLLVPHVSALVLLIILYSLVIGTMLVYALHLTKFGKVGWVIAVGAFLFVISDSFIAINKFYTSIPYNHWNVMVSYMTAQFLIIKGVTKYISNLSISNVPNNVHETIETP